ncbi:MAG: DUF4270 domain-containing protein [Flammeovirgaceae bacterium]|nr:DUF4270 domain-containing protein [Flammeovirgaceae bacterium]
MSLWGRGLGVIALLILLLISCEEDTSVLGFIKGNKFQVRYVEIDVPTSVMLADSLFAYNTPDVPESKRILVGNYLDDQFGPMRALAFTQFRPYNTAPSIPVDAVFDSLYITLTFDHYTYGSLTPSINFFNIHELTDTLYTSNLYYTNSTSSYDPSPLGSGFYAIDPLLFKENQDSSRIDTLRIGLSRTYGAKLFKYAKDSSEVISNFQLFSEVFRGFAILPETTDDRIVGITPENNLSSKWSRVSMYYTFDDGTGQIRRSRIDFTIYLVDNVTGALGYTNFTVDRSTSILAPMTVPYEEFLPPMIFAMSSREVPL